MYCLFVWVSWNFKFKYRKANQNESRPRIMKKRKKQLFSLFCITLAQVAVCVFMGAYVLVIGVLWGMCVRIVDCVGCMMCSTDCRMQCQQQHFLPFFLFKTKQGEPPISSKPKSCLQLPYCITFHHRLAAAGYDKSAACMYNCENEIWQRKTSHTIRHKATQTPLPQTCSSA